MEVSGPCGKCKEGEFPTKVDKVGKTLTVTAGSFVGDTIYEYYQCKKCGCLWQKTEDVGGVSRGGTFYKKITGF